MLTLSAAKTKVAQQHGLEHLCQCVWKQKEISNVAQTKGAPTITGGEPKETESKKGNWLEKIVMHD